MCTRGDLLWVLVQGVLATLHRHLQLAPLAPVQYTLSKWTLRICLKMDVLQRRVHRTFRCVVRRTVQQLVRQDLAEEGAARPRRRAEVSGRHDPQGDAPASDGTARVPASPVAGARRPLATWGPGRRRQPDVDLARPPLLRIPALGVRLPGGAVRRGSRFVGLDPDVPEGSVDAVDLGRV